MAGLFFLKKRRIVSNLNYSRVLFLKNHFEFEFEEFQRGFLNIRFEFEFEGFQRGLLKNRFEFEFEGFQGRVLLLLLLLLFSGRKGTDIPCRGAKTEQAKEPTVKIKPSTTSLEAGSVRSRAESSRGRVKSETVTEIHHILRDTLENTHQKQRSFILH